MNPQARSSVRANVVAGLAANLWQAALTVGLAPVYVRLMGAEAYGLVGLYGTLLVVLTVFDLGIATLVNREFATMSVRAEPGAAMRALLARLEKFYWLIGIALGTLLWLLAGALRSHWLRPGELDPGAIEQAVALMGLAIAARWPAAIYGNALAGLQRMVLMNAIAIAAAGATALGTVLLLWGVSGTPQAFFAAQAAGNAALTVALALASRRLVPRIPAAGEHAAITPGMRRFCAGITGITLVSVALSQVDKIALSRLLPLEGFGHYSVAVSIAAGLALVNAAIFAAHYPRFAQLLAAGDARTLARQYHAGCQAQAVLVFPLAAAAIAFPRELLALLGYSTEVIAAAALPLQVLVAATALNGAMHLPYALQFALGRTRLAFLLDLAAALVLVPLVIAAAQRYGAPGAAAGPLLQNLFYVTVGAQLMHASGLPEEKWRWYRQDLLAPLAASFAAALLVAWLFARAEARPPLLPAFAWAAAFAAALAAAPLARSVLPPNRAR